MRCPQLAYSFEYARCIWHINKFINIILLCLFNIVDLMLKNIGSIFNLNANSA